MSHQSDLIQADILAYLAQHERKEILRFLTCGNVDDGKSTLIGRLLHDSKMIYEDQLAAIHRDSKKVGTTGDNVDLALLVDGLQAEREQGITIDVAYRYFSTAKRKFIIADTPGHEQYTRNMATGASNCDVAVILIDAAHGVLTQTRRHTFIASLLGIRHIIVAVNKMDLVEYDQSVFERIRQDYLQFASQLQLQDLHFIPLSALRGDNVVEASQQMSWYQGPTLMQLLEAVEISADRDFDSLRFCVQRVNRPDSSFRGYSGSLSAGLIRPGMEVVVLPSGKRSQIARIVTMDGDLDEAYPPMAVTLTLTDEIDISRGDVLVGANHQPQVASNFLADLVWMAEEPMVPGRQYILKQGTRQVLGQVATLRERIDINTLARQHAPTLALNEIGCCEFSLSEPLVFDAYQHNKDTGAFILIDRISNATVGAGMIRIQAQADATAAQETQRNSIAPVSAEERSQRLGQAPLTLLISGADSRARAQVAQALERQLFDMGRLAKALHEQTGQAGSRLEALGGILQQARLLNEAGLIALLCLGSADDDLTQLPQQMLAAELVRHVHLQPQGEPALAGAHLNLALETLSMADCAARIAALLQQQNLIR